MRRTPCEELWQILGNKESVFKQAFPKENPDALVLDETEYAVQVNSKIVCKTMIASDLNNDDIEAKVLVLPEVVDRIAGKSVKKFIVVKGRLINLIVG